MTFSDFFTFCMKFGAVLLIGRDVRGRNKNNSLNTSTSGLPSTSPSTRMLGRLAAISSISHPNLCRYLEMFKCQTVPHGVLIVSEHYSDRYIALRNDPANPHFSYKGIHFSVAIQICSALEFCHRNSIILGSLCLDNILVCANPENEHIRVKLAHFGLYHISGGNADVEELISSPWYLAPECLLVEQFEGDGGECCSYYTDIWAFGILLVELFTGCQMSLIWSRKQFLSVITAIVLKTKQGSCLNNLLAAMKNSCSDLRTHQALLDPVHSIVENCVEILPTNRPIATNLFRMLQNASIFNAKMPIANERQNSLDEPIDAIKERIRNERGLTKYGFNENCLNELFFLWKLCGTSVETILTRAGIIQSHPPVLTLPRLLINENQFYGNERTRKSSSFLKITELPLNNLVERLDFIPRGELFTILELRKLGNQLGMGLDSADSSCQSLVVKERDINYQIKRMRLFRHLLASWPYKADMLRRECQRDIPPVYRGAAWAALLDIPPSSSSSDHHDQFYAIDTFSEHQSDRQLQVDIPRCHQYDELMSSPTTHYRMKLLIKALLIHRKDDYVYWQGLDSLSAPFLMLHFNDLPTAFRCLNAFIDRYLSGFFLRDNSVVIRNYLAEFMRALEFSDPELFAHLISLDFHPELFAIPWFLTCFAHVLPLHKLFHLWDSLLLADSEFPLFIGVAILIQLRSRLISVNFNEAILLFSDLPDLSIDEVVQIAKIHYLNWQAQGQGRT